MNRHRGMHHLRCCIFNIPSLAWDPILRTAALARLERFDEASAAYEELLTGFPDVAADPQHHLRGYIFIDEVADQVVAALRLADSVNAHQLDRQEF